MSKDLIERLLDNRVTGFNLTVAAVEAATMIEAQAAQIEQKNVALKATAMHVRPTCGELYDQLMEALHSTPNEALQAFFEKVREQCAQVCDNERLEEAEHEADRAYNMSIKHCTSAIRNLTELPK